MDDLLRHVRWIHASLVVVCVGLLLAVSNPRSAVDEARRELETIRSILDWQRPGWFERSSLDHFGLPAPELIPTAIGFTPTGALRPYSSLSARFPRLIRLSESEYPLEDVGATTLHGFFAYWSRLLKPIGVEVFVEPDYQARRQSATSRYVANDATIRPVVNDPYEPGTWIIPSGEYISDVDVEFLFDQRPTTHLAVIIFDSIGPDFLAGQTRAFFEVESPEDRPFFLQQSFDAGPPFGQLEYNGFELTFAAHWRHVEVSPQVRITRAFPEVFGGEPVRSFPALHKLSSELGDMELEKLDRVLTVLGRELSNEKTFSAFGLALPINLILLWAVPLVVVIQTYLSLYLSQLVLLLKKECFPVTVVWIGVIENTVARLISWTTICVLPAGVALLFAWRLVSSTTGLWAAGAFLVSMLGLSAAFSCGKSLRGISQLRAGLTRP